MAAVLPDSGYPLESSEDKQERLRQLGALAPQAALREIAGLIASVASADSLPVDQRIKLLRQLEDTAQRHLIPCSREYLTSPHRGEDSQHEEFRLWRTNREFWTQLASAYNACFNDYADEVKDDALHKAELTRLVVRLLHAYGARLKWDQFRYGPHSEAFWQVIGRAYLFAVGESVDRRRVTAFSGSAAETTVEREYLKILAFQASSMDSLLPLEVDIAERLIAHFLPEFSFAAEQRPEHTHWIDAGQRRAPARLQRTPPDSPNVRYFGVGQALSGFTELQRALDCGEMPGDLNLGRAYSPRIVLPVVRHLAAYWGSHQPRREFDRYRVSSRLTVVSGLPGIHRRLVEASELDAANAATGAEWLVDNVSRGGMGAHLPLSDQEAGSPVQIGTLLGMRPEGGENWLVGVVRRLARENDAQAAIGIETLAKKAVAFDVDSGGRQGAALLLDALDPGEMVRMALPAIGAADMTPLTVSVEGRTARLKPVELIERGVAFDLARYCVETVV